MVVDIVIYVRYRLNSSGIPLLKVAFKYQLISPEWHTISVPEKYWNVPGKLK